MNQPFWEEAYARDDMNAFSAEANPTLRKCCRYVEILQFRSYIVDDQHGDMPRHQHAANKLVARRLR